MSFLDEAQKFNVLLGARLYHVSYLISETTEWI
jgi:hypothetical protein